MLSLSLIAEVFGYSRAYMMPVIAREILGVEADGLGYLMAAYGAGGACFKSVDCQQRGIQHTWVASPWIDRKLRSTAHDVCSVSLVSRFGSDPVCDRGRRH